jgi:hypothetical protein
MSDPPPSSPSSGVLISISERLIRVLPPAFLLLIVMNVLFLGALAWVVNHNAEARNAMLTRIVEKCLLTPSGRQGGVEALPPSGLERG